MTGPTTKLLLTAASVLAARSADAALQEIMLLTNWGEALERYGPADATQGVRFGTKDATLRNQKWFVDQAANTISSFDGLCLTAASKDWNFQADLVVIMATCTGSADQRWVYSTTERTFRVTLTKDGGSATYCLDADVGTRPQNVIHGWNCSPASSPNVNQQWKLFYPGYQVKVGDKCVALAQDNHEDEPYRVVNCDNNPLQMWKYDFAAGSLRLGDPASVMCVDSYPAGESGMVHTWTCDATNLNQQIDFKIKSTDGNTAVSGWFFSRDTTNYLTLSADGSRLISAPFDASTAVFTLLTELPGDLCAGKTCQNGGTCNFGRCRCPDHAQGDDCSIVGTQVRLRASNGRFLSATTSAYTLEYALLGGDKRQQVWYYFPTTGMIKLARRRMCLQAYGDTAILAVCSLADATAKWTYDVANGRLQLQNSNRCLDTDVRSANHIVRMKDCTSSANQVWDQVTSDALPLNSDMFVSMVRHRESLSLCWTVQSGQVVTAPCQGSVSQLWTFNDAYSGAGALCNGESCVVAKTSDNAKGLVTLATYDGQRLDERFEYESATGLIRMANTDKCIAKSSDGSNRLLLATCSTKDTAQFWYLPKLDKCLSDDFLTLKNKCVMGKCEFGRCQCQPGFQGFDCSYDSCSLLQCNNGGTCALGKCTCADGYDGTFCDTFTKCKGVKCLHGGVCSRDGKCACPVGVSGDRCHVQHAKVLLRALEYQAIGLEGGLVTTVIPDVRKSEHAWVWDTAKSMLRSAASSTVCLEHVNEKDVSAAVCNATKAEQKWAYDAAKGKLFAGKDGQSGVFLGLEESVSGRYRPRLGSAFGPSSAGFDLGFVELDRLDLPGTSIRTSDRSKCLSASTSGALALATCSTDDEAQQWEYHPQNGVLRLPRLGAPVCLVVSGGSVTVAKCNGEDPAQQFDFDFATKRYKNRKSNACLTFGSSGSLVTSECASDASSSTAATQTLHTPFRGFCDVINLCEGGGACAFGRCVCAGGRSGGFCEIAVDAV